MTWKHKQTSEKLKYTPAHIGPGSICPHGNYVCYADECDECMEEYE